MSKRNFKEPQALNDVADFHDLFDMPVLDEPAIPSMDRCKLRRRTKRTARRSRNK